MHWSENKSASSSSNLPHGGHIWQTRQRGLRLTNAFAALKSQIQSVKYSDLLNIKALNIRIEYLKSVPILGPLRAGAKPAYYTQRDPTLFIAGLQSKWPTNWDENLQVRLFDIDDKSGAYSVDSHRSSLSNHMRNQVPEDLDKAMESTLGESYSLYNSQVTLSGLPSFPLQSII